MSGTRTAEPRGGSRGADGRQGQVTAPGRRRDDHDVREANKPDKPAPAGDETSWEEDGPRSLGHHRRSAAAQWLQ